jgi:predicted enzyme related to lactoylglutathione lyase
MQQAIHWYSELLGLQVQSASHEGTIYILPMEGGSELLLDSNMNNRENNNKTQFFFETKNLIESYKFIKNKGIEIVTKIEVHENISFFTFRDPDGNVLMICEDKRKL